MLKQIYMSLFYFLLIIGPAQGALSSKQAKHFLNSALDQYSGEIEAQSGYPVVKYYYFSNDIFQAQAGLVKDTGQVEFTFYGGLLWRLDSIEELAVIFCHELGHVMGGAPEISAFNSVEGQADYFATSICMKEIYQSGLLKVKEFKSLSSEWDLCDRYHTEEQDIRICVNSLFYSIKVLSKIYSDDSLNLNIKDENIVPRTLFTYPSKNCRVQSIVQGALCDLKGNCDSGRQRRPSCWFFN